MNVIIQGKKTTTLDEFYNQISDQLKFPSYFGRNLDALWDLLSGGDINSRDGKVNLVWENAEVSRRSMGDSYEKLAKVLRRVEKNCKDFKFQEL